MLRKLTKRSMQRIVTKLPLNELWSDVEFIIAKRERYLNKENLRQILKNFPVEFIVADIGLKLQRISIDKCYGFWKSEVERHLIDNPEKRFNIESFPDEYAYMASEWTGEFLTPIILLEKYH